MARRAELPRLDSANQYHTLSQHQRRGITSISRWRSEEGEETRQTPQRLVKHPASY